MINIAFIIDTIESPTAGTEKQLIQLIEHLDREKFIPFLCVLKSSAWLESSFTICEVFEVGCFSWKSLKSIRTISRLKGFLETKDIQILQLHFVDSAIVGSLAGYLAGTKTIIGTRRSQGYWLTPIKFVLQRCINSFAHHFVANSNSTKQWSIETEKLSSTKISVIHNWVDMPPFGNRDTEISRDIREKLYIAPDTVVVGSVANLRSVKGYDVFLAAASLVKDSIPNVKFVIIGDGPEESKLRVMAEDLGISDLVLFLGRQEDVTSFLKIFDIGVLSSLSESFSNTLLEYLAAGLPVVATNVGGVAEVISEDVTAEVVEPGSSEALAAAVIRVADNNMKYCPNNVRRVEIFFSISNSIQKYEKLYCSLNQ